MIDPDRSNDSLETSLGQPRKPKMMQPSQHLAEDVLALNQVQPRTVTSLLTGQCRLRKYLQEIGIS